MRHLPALSEHDRDAGDVAPPDATEAALLAWWRPSADEERAAVAEREADAKYQSAEGRAAEAERERERARDLLPDADRTDGDPTAGDRDEIDVRDRVDDGARSGDDRRR